MFSLLPLVQQVVMGAMKASGSGLIGKMRETRTIADFMESASTNYPGNPLIEGIIGALTGGSDEFKDLLDDAPDINNLDLDEVLANVSRVDDVLQGFGDHAAQFKQFVFDLASKIVLASGSGLFGMGHKVSENEATFLNALRDGLKLQHG
jgi:hypothetical protein